jgi:hypothetical protein
MKWQVPWKFCGGGTGGADALHGGQVVRGGLSHWPGVGSDEQKVCLWSLHACGVVEQTLPQRPKHPSTQASGQLAAHNQSQVEHSTQALQPARRCGMSACIRCVSAVLCVYAGWCVCVCVFARWAVVLKSVASINLTALLAAVHRSCPTIVTQVLLWCVDRSVFER